MTPHPIPRAQRLKILFAPIIITYVSPLPWRGHAVNRQDDYQYKEKKYQNPVYVERGWSE